MGMGASMSYVIPCLSTASFRVYRDIQVRTLQSHYLISVYEWKG